MHNGLAMSSGDKIIPLLGKFKNTKKKHKLYGFCFLSHYLYTLLATVIFHPFQS